MPDSSWLVKYIITDRTGRDPMPCIAGRYRQDARELRDADERVIKVRVTEIKS